MFTGDGIPNFDNIGKADDDLFLDFFNTGRFQSHFLFQILLIIEYQFFAFFRFGDIQIPDHIAPDLVIPADCLDMRLINPTFKIEQTGILSFESLIQRRRYDRQLRVLLCSGKLWKQYNRLFIDFFVEIMMVDHNDGIIHGIDDQLFGGIVNIIDLQPINQHNQ